MRIISKAGPIAHVGQPWIFVTTKVSLQDATIVGSIEHCAPSFEFTHPVGRFLGVQFGHAPVVDVLATAHGVGEMHFPVVAIIDIGQRGRDPALGHYRVRFAEQTFANHPDRYAGGGCFDRCAQSCTAGADNKNVVLESFVVGHEIIVEALKR